MKFISYYFSIIFLCTFLSFSTNVQAQQKIAHINSDELIALMPEYKQAKSEVETYSKVLQKELDDQQAAIQKYLQEVSEKINLGQMSPLEQKDAEAKLTKMKADLQTAAGKADQKLLDKEQKLTKPLYDKFNAALEKVAKANGYAYIFDLKMAMYTGGGIDATSLVKTELGL